jgi:hypothetical protein
VEKQRTSEKEARKVVQHSSAVLAAGCGRRGIKEEKQTRKALVGLDVVDGKEEMTAGVSPLWMVPSKVGRLGWYCLDEFLSSPLSAHVTTADARPTELAGSVLYRPLLSAASDLARLPRHVSTPRPRPLLCSPRPLKGRPRLSTSFLILILILIPKLKRDAQLLWARPLYSTEDGRILYRLVLQIRS